MEIQENRLKTTTREGTLLLISTLTVMAGAAISPAIQSMSIFFNEIPNAIFLSKLSLTIPALSFVIFAFIIGFIIDKWGRKPVLISSLILYLVAGTAGFYLKSLYAIIASRAILGIASAGITNSTITLIADYYQGSKRNRVIGFQTAFSALGGVIYLLIGGALADVGWNYPFLIYLAPVLFLPFAIFSLYEPKKQHDPYDKLNENNQSEIKIIDINSTIKDETKVLAISISYFLIFITMLVFYLGPTQLSFYIPQIVTSVNNFQIGIAMAILNLTAGLIGLFYRPIKKLLDFQFIFILGFIVVGIGFLIISFAQNYIMIIIAALIGGLGFGLIMPNLSLYLVSNTSHKIRGRVFSGYNAMLFTGQFLSPIIFEPIINRTNLSTTFLVGGIIFISLIIVSIILLLLKLGNRKQSSKEFEEKLVTPE